MNQQERKYFGDKNGRLNADDAPFALAPNEWINAENIRSLTTDDGETSVIESIGGTLLLSEPQPSIVFLTVGQIADPANNRFLKFLYNTTGNDHKITCVYLTHNTYFKYEFDVLLSSQVTGGLNFQKNTIIHSGFVINGLLYWCEGTSNEPRRIDIDAALNLNNPGMFFNYRSYSTPIDASVIRWIRRQPGLPPTITKANNSYPNNFIQNDAFEFSYFYTYVNNEQSTPSAKSLLAPYNQTSQNYNYISVVIPFGESIQQDVQMVSIIAYYYNENAYFIIKQWDKSNPSDLAEIEAHNAQTTALTYNFYNDFTGISVAQTVAEKEFDVVPIYANTCANAINRAFFANEINGYTTPLFTSLTAGFKTSTDGTLTAQWVIVIYNHGSSTHYFLDMGTYGFFDITPQPLPPPYPSTEAYADMTYIAAGAADWAVYVAAHYPGWINGLQYPGYSATITGGPPVPGLTGTTCFKTGATYQVSIEFLDHSGRKCGILTNDTLKIANADRTYDTLTYSTAIQWTLNNTNALLEIPEWAYYYSINVTKCLTTRFFLQARAKNVTYVTKDASGNYVFNTSTYAATGLYGVGINIGNLFNYGMGYVLQPGDLVKLYISGSPLYILSVKDQSGDWLICQTLNVGTIGTTGAPLTTALFQIYTPYKPSTTEPYYEVGNIFPVTNPGTDLREYSTVGGSLGGDVTLLTRNDGSADYLTENMSPNDTYYMNWFDNSGRPNFIDTIGQTIEPDTYSWSNTFIQGTKTNGLSTFDALGTGELSQEAGAISKLQITSKVANQLGIVMLAICEQQTASMYLGEVQQYGSTGTQQNIVTTVNIVGTINILKGSYGTINPESIIEFRGEVYWLDMLNGKVIQYSINGLDVVTYKMERFWKNWCAKFLSMTSDEIETMGGRPFVFGGIDPYHREILFSLPQLDTQPPNGYLPDYPSTIYPFDILDYQAKTVVYKLGRAEAPPHWQGSYKFYSESFINLGNNLYSSRYGLSYLHNQSNNYCNFYGVQEKARIMFISNAFPNVPKVYNNIGVQPVSLTPTLTYFYNNIPVQQASDLVDFDYNNLEGVNYATLYRNKLIPTFDGFVTTGLLTGEKMRNSAMYIMLEFSPTSTPLELSFVNIGFVPSAGQLNQINT